MNTKIVSLIILCIAIVIGIWYFTTNPISTDHGMNNVAFLNQEPSFQIQSKEVEYFNNIKGYYASPTQEGEYAGVVMIHEWWGLNENIKEMADQLAGQGYQVLAVDLYQNEVAQTPERARELRTSIDQQESVENMKAAVTFLRDQGANNVASLGWCFGGGQSMQLALSDVDLEATIIYYGSLVTESSELEKIQWPVLGIFGEEDQSIPVETVQSFDQALDDVGVENEIYVYPGVGHAFANPSGDNYAPQETRDAWQKTLSFLEKHLQ